MSDQQDSTAPVESQVENEDLIEGESLEASEDQPEQDRTQAKSAEEKAIEKALKEYEVKVNGKTKKIALDLNDEESIKKYLSKAEAAQETFTEAAKYRKQAEQLVEMLKNDPLSVLRNPALGVDVKKLAEMVLDEQLEEASLTPEQKRIKELEKNLNEREAKEKAEKEAKEAAEKERLTREMYEKTEKDMIAALDKSEIAASPYTVRRAADIMSALVEAGWEDISIEKAMPLVEKMVQDELGQHFLKHKDPSKLEKLVGKDLLKEYRKSKISSVKKTPNANTLETGKKTADAQKEVPKKTKLSDWGNPW